MSDYEVGYGKPPRAGQFKQGNTAASKNKRKPKQTMSLPDILSRALTKPVRIKRGNEIVSITAGEVMIERIIRMMVHGTGRELVMTMGLVEKYAPEFLAATPEIFKVEYHRAEGSNVPLPPMELWEEDGS